MIRRMTLFLSCLALLALSGCSAQDIETQAYAVSLGVDLLEDGGICVSVQVPALNQGGGSESGGESGGSGGGTGYTFASANGRTLIEALDMLHATLPRALNLTGVKCIVVSEELARSDRFAEVLHEMALSYRVYGAAELVVSRSKAQEVIRSQQPVIGQRLSESMSVALKHYQETGTIPSARVSDVYYLSRSVYGDPTAILAALKDEDGAQQDGKTALAGEIGRSGGGKIEYFGTALFRAGKMIGMLDGKETQLMTFLRGELESFSRTTESGPVRLIPAGKPKITVCTAGDAPIIEAHICMEMLDPTGKAETAEIERKLTEEFSALTEKCMKMGTDPFGFAEKAAAQFTTMQEWMEYNWRQRIEAAEVRCRTEVRRAEY